MNKTLNKIKAFRQAKGWSLQQLAQATGTSKSQIDKLERGERRLSVDWMVRLAKPLGCDPRELIAMKAPATTSPPASERFLSVFTLQAEKPNAPLSLSPQAIDQTLCPPNLRHALEAYAVYLADDRYFPLFRTGQTLFIAPKKPAHTGLPLLLEREDGMIELGLLLSETETHLTLQTFGRKTETTTFQREKLTKNHLITGVFEAC